MKIKDFMTQDHDRIDQLLSEFLSTQDKEPQRANDLFREFEADLRRHIAWEDTILLPSIERHTGMHMPGPAVLVRAQHQQIKTLLEKASAQILNKGDKAEALLKELVDLLALHSQEEERVLYPWIDLSLNEADREEALEQMRHLR